MAAPPKQDMPPQGGYAPIQWKKNIPKRGVSGIVLMLGLVPWTYYLTKLKMMEFNERHRILWERREAQRILAPLHIAEFMRQVLRMQKRNQEIEALIMADVPGWSPGASCYSEEDKYPEELHLLTLQHDFANPHSHSVNEKLFPTWF